MTEETQKMCTHGAEFPETCPKCNHIYDNEEEYWEGYTEP
jgi:hypothetical protein